MRTRKRYRLDRIQISPLPSRAASWSFAGTPLRGTELAFAVVDANYRTRNEWEFIVRVPKDRKGRIEVRPRTVPKLRAWAELTDRSLTFSPATRGTARGKWYGTVALADPTGQRSRTIVNVDARRSLPHWFTALDRRMRRKATVRPTKGTDANALVVLVAAGDYPDMIRLFFATKVWILSERVVL